MDINNITITGNLCVDPVLKKANDKSVVNTRIGVAGFSSHSLFINISVFGLLAENLAKYKKKGDKIGITGKLINKKYTDKLGEQKENWFIKVESLVFLWPPRGGEKDGNID